MPNVCEVRAYVLGGWHGGVVVVVVVESPPSSISLCGSKKPISMAYCPATDPIRFDPIRPASIFFFVSFPFLTVTFASSFAPLRFDLIARRARARATCGSYSSATSTAAQADAPTPYTRVHATCNSRNPAEASGMLRIKHTMLLGCVPKKRLVNAKNEEEMQEKK